MAQLCSKAIAGIKSHSRYQHFVDNQLLDRHNLLIMNMKYLVSLPGEIYLT